MRVKITFDIVHIIEYFFHFFTILLKMSLVYNWIYQFAIIADNSSICTIVVFLSY